MIKLTDISFISRTPETLKGSKGARDECMPIGLLKNSVEVLNKKFKSFLASSVSTYDLTTLYTTLPHNQRKTY